MNAFTIDKGGMYRGGLGQLGHTNIIRAIAIDLARAAVKGSTAVVDNSGGTASVLSLPAPLVDVNASGSNLVAKADFETALGSVNDALQEIFTAANALSAKLGLAQVSFASGAAADGTIAAVDVAPAGAATGPAAAGVNAVLGNVNNAFYMAQVVVGRLAAALGVPHNSFTLKGALVSSVPAVATDTGAASAKGVALTDAVNVLKAYQGNVHTLASVLIAAVAAHTPGVLVID